MPLVPGLYRRSDGSSRENQLLQTFRARAAAFGADRGAQLDSTSISRLLACGLVFHIHAALPAWFGFMCRLRVHVDVYQK